MFEPKIIPSVNKMDIFNGTCPHEHCLHNEHGECEVRTIEYKDKEELPNVIECRSFKSEEGHCPVCGKPLSRSGELFPLDEEYSRQLCNNPDCND